MKYFHIIKERMSGTVIFQLGTVPVMKNFKCQYFRTASTEICTDRCDTDVMTGDRHLKSSITVPYSLNLILFCSI